MKKTLPILLSICMLISITAGIDFSAFAYTYTGSCGDNVTYEFDSSTDILIISGSGPMYDYSIGKSVFYYHSSIESIIINSGVTSIGSHAFESCKGLKSVTIPNSVTSISGYAFEECEKLTNVTIPNSVTSINSCTFYGCTGLTSIEIPNNVTSIGVSAFHGCTGLTSIEIPNNVTSIGNEAFSGCTGLTSIEIPNNVTSIGYGAFECCTGLTSIEIPSSVTSIGPWIFAGCTGLTNITVDSNNTVYDSRDNCNAIIKTSTNELIAGCKKTVIPNEVTSIGSYVFYKCTGLTSVTIPNSVTSIGAHAFSYCEGLTSITLPNSVTSIGSHAFESCKGLKSVTIPNSVTSISGYAFEECEKLTNVTIPNSVTSINSCTFYGCTGLTSVTMPNSVKSIGKEAFRNCTGLTSVTIPNSVKSIYESAFYNCTGLKDVYYSGSKSEWNWISIYSNNSSLTNAIIHYESFTINKHANRFVHSSNYTDDGFYGVKNYYVSVNYRNKLTKGMSKDEKAFFIDDVIKHKWDGSCYGTSVAMGLAYLEKLPVVNDSEKGNFRNMELPWKNKPFLDNINYYQLIQSVDSLNVKKEYFCPGRLGNIGKEGTYNSLESYFNSLIKTIDDDGIAVVTFGYKQFLNMFNQGGHAILALDYSVDDNGEYEFKIYDLNSYVSEKYASSHEPCEGKFTKLLWNPESKQFKYIDPDGDIEADNSNYVYLSLTDFDDLSLANNSNAKSSKSGGKTFTFSVDSDSNYTLKSSDGKTFTYKDGDFNSDMEVVDVNVSSGYGINGNKSKYTFTVSGDADFILESEDNSAKISLYNDNEFLSFESDNFDSVDIDLNNGVEVNGNNCEYSVSLNERGNEEGIYTLSGTQKALSSIQYDKEKITVNSDNDLNNVNVSYLDTESEELEDKELVSNLDTDKITIDESTIKSEGKVVYCDHKTVDTVIAPTCTSKGYTIHACENCEYKYTDSYTSEIAHKWNSGEITTQPSFKANGVRTYTCSVCNTKKTESINKLGSPQMTKLKKAKKSFTAQWSWANGVDGYQVQYSLKKNFKKSTTKYSKGTKLTVKKLKSKKTYYVRVRAYKKINGRNYYSSWSTKKVKVK